MFKNKKTVRIITAVIALIMVLALVLPILFGYIN